MKPRQGFAFSVMVLGKRPSLPLALSAFIERVKAVVSSLALEYAPFAFILRKEAMAPSLALPLHLYIYM